MRSWRFVLLASAALSACGGRVDPPGAAPDGGAALIDAPITPLGFSTAPHEPLPIVGSTGGPTLAHPVVVPVYFPDEGHRIDVDSFLALLPGSEYWRGTTSEYGVGDVTIGAAIVSKEALPAQMTTDQVKAWLASRFEGGAAGWPWAADPSAVYALFFPEGTTITGELGQSCKDFKGYHGELHQGSAHTVFAVIPRCIVDGVPVVDEITRNASHALIEAATDPYTASHRAYWTTDSDHIAWTLMTLGEVADRCELEPQSYARLLGTSSVARSWSNKAALAGHDPCGPALQATSTSTHRPCLRTRCR